MTWTWLRKKMAKEEDKKRKRISINNSKNNIIGTNYIKVKIDNTQQNSKCCLCGDREMKQLII